MQRAMKFESRMWNRDYAEIRLRMVINWLKAVVHSERRVG